MTIYVNSNSKWCLFCQKAGWLSLFRSVGQFSIAFTTFYSFESKSIHYHTCVVATKLHWEIFHYIYCSIQFEAYMNGRKQEKIKAYVLNVIMTTFWLVGVFIIIIGCHINNPGVDQTQIRSFVINRISENEKWNRSHYFICSDRINVTIFRFCCFVQQYWLLNSREREKKQYLKLFKWNESARRKYTTTAHEYTCFLTTRSVRTSWLWRIGKNWNLRFLERVTMIFPAAIVSLGYKMMLPLPLACAQINQVLLYRGVETLSFVHFHFHWLPTYYTQTHLQRNYLVRSENHNRIHHSSTIEMNIMPGIHGHLVSISFFYLNSIREAPFACISSLLIHC